jgi:tryptophan-rich sensory protein
VTAVLTVPLLIVTFLYSVKAGIALIHYQIWIFTAAALASSYAAKN